MQVTVKLLASFRIKWFREAIKNCPDNATIIDIVNEIGIPDYEICIVLINGQHASLHDTLHDGDVVSLMPLMGGG